MSTKYATIVRAVFSLVTLASTYGTPSLSCPCQDIPKPAADDPSYSRQKGLDFTHTAAYRKEFSEAIRQARQACLRHLGEKNVAIVSDIDETLLDNRLEFERHPKFTWELFDQWINESVAPTLKPTFEFLSWARAHGFAVFLITGRTEDQRRATINNLVKRNVSFDGLYMRPEGTHALSEEMKSTYRKQIEAMGFKIVVNIGDQVSDLYGGSAEDCEKLPNRIYYIP